jgi:hypothetical protein
MKLNVMRFAVARRIRAMPAGEREGLLDGISGSIAIAGKVRLASL